MIGRRRPGLRVTMAVVTGLGTLAVSILVGVATYLSARHFLVAQRESSALAQAFADASYVSVGLQSAGADVKDLITQQIAGEREVLVRSDGRWFSTTVSQGESALPSDVVDGVRAGAATYSWTLLGDEPTLVVGVPLNAANAEFYEVVRTPVLASTLATFQKVLTVCAIGGGLLGSVLGRAFAAQVLRPLRRVARRAAAVRDGTSTQRLGVTGDPDLEPIVDSLNSMMDALQARRRRDTQFAVDAAHELRSPLMTLTTSLTVVRNRGTELPVNARTAVDLMSREVDRLRHTVEDLLELGRLSERQFTSTTEEVDPVQLARETLRISGRRETLLEVPGQPVVAELDKSRVARALLNLLDNADIHGGGASCLRVISTKDGVLFEVDDAGPGVPVQDRERIFERFARGSRTTRQGRLGSGLGLSIVKEITLANGGEVTVTSSNEGGARFILSFPLKQRPTVDTSPNDLAVRP